MARLCNDSSLHGSALTEFVGREEELELLLRRWTKAKTGEGEMAQYHCDEGIQDIAD